MIKDVLLFCPVYRLEPETVQSIFALEWDGALSVLYQEDNQIRTGAGRNDGIGNHYHQYVRGREAFLAGPYDALMIIESDIIVPPDALQKLAALDVDLAYGCYVFRVGRMEVSQGVPHGVGRDKNDMLSVNVFERYRDRGGRQARNVGEPLNRRGLWQDALRAGQVDCSGGGFGCVLIKRHVIEAVPFRLVPNGGHCDSPFTQDAYQAGYTMRADTTVICGHKDIDGEILWPPT